MQNLIMLLRAILISGYDKAASLVEEDQDLALFKRRFNRALRLFPTHYTSGARVFRDPVTRTKIVGMLGTSLSPATEEAVLHSLAASVTAQGSACHVGPYDDASDQLPQRLAVLQDVAWLPPGPPAPAVAVALAPAAA